MTFDAFLDYLEQHGLQILMAGLVVLLSVMASRTGDSVERRLAKVCRDLYERAPTAADTARIDPAHPAVRAPDHTAVVPTQSCGDLRRDHVLD